MRVLALFALGAGLYAQERPQFVWQGDVDGIVFLYLRDNHLAVTVKEGGPVQRQRFQFHDRLTQVQQNARLEVAQGRGFVHIVDQPRLENEYTLGVAIEDRQEGHSFYSISLFWDASSQFFEGKALGKRDRVEWSGRVDQQAIVSCQGKTCVSSAATGAPVATELVKFSRPLPNRQTEVSLEEAQGRGEIRLVESPRQENNYTARVSIRDPLPGSGEYSFVLAWTRHSGKEPDLPVYVPRPGVIWHGSVNGVVRVTIQRGASFSEVVRGGPIGGERSEFIKPLPARSDLKPTLKLLRARGHVEIAEYPSDRNNYRLVLQINDSEDGTDEYEIEVDW